jgi:RNA polymerase subunit RPABC4/transcription elongation factor Spt4
MSRMTPHDLQCPHCGNKQETMVWDSINVSLDPELKTKLYAAEINLFECQKCQKKTFINAPLLYHDMEMQFCVQYYPRKALDDEGFHRQFNADGSIAVTGMPAAFAESGAYITRPHIVFDMNEMIRYVAFRDRVAAANKK